MQNLHSSFPSSRSVPALHPFHAFFVGVSEGKKNVTNDFFPSPCVLFFVPLNLCDNTVLNPPPFLSFPLPQLSTSLRINVTAHT